MNGDGQALDGRPVAPSWERFAPLYDACVKRLYHLALLLCGGEEATAEDALADAFERCYQAWTGGDVVDVGSYARQALIANVVARDAPSGSGRGAGGDPTFGQLGVVPVAQRIAVVLRYYEDLSYEEIATAMNATVATVKDQIASGLEQLREGASPPR